MSNTTAMSARNKKFWAMTPEKQRIAVAKDVLKSLASGLLKAEQGKYILFTHVKRAWEYKNRQELPAKLDTLFTELHNNNAGRCQVCGIGSCFVSLVNLGNNVPTTQIVDSCGLDTWNGVSSKKLRPLLRKIFKPHQLTLIECAFEQSSSFKDEKDYTPNTLMAENKLKAIAFGDKYSKPVNRLKGIMRNIIANKGTFKP